MRDMATVVELKGEETLAISTWSAAAVFLKRSYLNFVLCFAI